MKVKIKRLDSALPLPTYATGGSVGFDLLARLDITIPPKAIALVPTNVIVEVPVGFALVIASRSSTPKKYGLTPPHGLGIIDQDYCGPEDEVRILVRNFTENEVLVRRGDKIAQGIFVRTERFEFEEVVAVNNKTRGGFGSTG
jgi:dUTP pyrophosphatase